LDKQILGTIAVILTFIGYVPYICDILKNKTTPHIYSWFLWGFVTALAFALQIADHAGPGAYVTLAAAVLCGVVLVLSFAKKSQKDIQPIDGVFITLAFISLGLWLIAKQPVISAILTTLTDLLGFMPTIRKSWNKPWSETLSFYWANTFRFGLAMFALNRYTVMTALYPLAWLLANGLFAVMLMVRRKCVKEGRDT
jgi:uncharacterized protein with PQ loop repeat